MRVDFLAENFENFIPLLNKTIPAHSQVPVLANILLEATKEGLFISATDLDLGIRIKVPGKIEEEGALTAPGKQFTEVIASLPRDKVSLTHEKDQLVLSSRGNKISFQTIGREEFPNLFEEKGGKFTSFTTAEFRDIFSKLLFAASFDDTRPELTGVYIGQKEGFVDFVTTDGFRMSLKRIKKTKLMNPGEGIILSSKPLFEAMAIKGNDTISMFVYKEGNQVMFETPTITLVGRLIDGSFPNYERVIPEETSTKITFDREELLQAIKLSSVFAREAANIIKIKIEEGVLKIFSKSSGVGEGEIKIEVEQTGGDNGIAFNSKFLGDLLRSLDDERLTMGMNSELEPAIFTTEKDPDFLHIIMPVRVTE